MKRRTIAHTTDLSGDDVTAFVHAAAIASATGARLVTVYGGERRTEASLPDATELARRWGRSVEHRRVCHACCDDVADTVLDAIDGIAPDLIITGTHARRGLSAVLHASVAEAVARNAAAPTLVVPNRCRGFADLATGAVHLERVLVPAGDAATARRGIAAAASLTALAGARTPVEIVVLHVGEGTIAGELVAPEGTRLVARSAAPPVDRAIVEVARDLGACVIVMPTRGHDGVADVLLGSHTEHVIRTAGCPVLSCSL